jgi:hypothetical protein
VVVVVFGFAADAVTGGFVVGDWLVAQPAMHSIAIATPIASLELVVYFIIQTPVYFVLGKRR